MTGDNKIKKINLIDCKLTHVGGFAIFSTVQRSNKIIELNISKNYLDGSKLRVIRDMLTQNKSLTILNASHC